MQEHNDARELAQHTFTELEAAVKKLSHVDRDRENSFKQSMNERDKQQAAFFERCEQKIFTYGRKELTRARLYCAAVTILSLTFSGLFCYSQNQAKQISALQANTEIEARVTQQLRRVEPSAYAMALEITKHGHEVVLSDGLAAWEVDLYRSSGIVGIESVPDKYNGPDVFRVYIRGNPERVTLASLAASAKNGDTQSVAK